MSSDFFLNKFTNIKKLYDENVYSYTEYTQEIDKLIDILSKSKIEESPEEFLLKIAPLVSNNFIDFENLTKIKKILINNYIYPNFNNEHSENIQNTEDSSVEVENHAIPLEEYNILKPQYTPEINSNTKSKKGKETKSKYPLFLFLVVFLILLIIYLNYNNNSNNKSNANYVQKNDNSTSNNSSSQVENTQKKIKLSEPCIVVKDWIVSLGDGNFSHAYYLMKGKKWGSLSNFQSTKSYGGINRTNFINCETSYTGNTATEVIAEYEAYDPYNNDGKYTQKFILEKSGLNWYITNIVNLNIITYRYK